MTKAWYLSKTLWVNAIALVCIVVQLATGQEWLDAEQQVAIIAAINVFLRLITGKPLTLYKD